MDGLRKLLDEAARRTCQEICAMYGEPPCWRGDDAVWPNPKCDQPGCGALAKACAEPLAAALAKAEGALEQEHSHWCAQADAEIQYQMAIGNKRTETTAMRKVAYLRATLTEIRKLTGAA